MKALVNRGSRQKALEDRPMPEITAPTGAIVKAVKTTVIRRMGNASAAARACIRIKPPAAGFLATGSTIETFAAETSALKAIIEARAESRT